MKEPEKNLVQPNLRRVAGFGGLILLFFFYLFKFRILQRQENENIFESNITNNDIVLIKVAKNLM